MMPTTLGESNGTADAVVACSYELHDSRTVVGDDTPLLVLIHGVGLDRSVWRNQVGPLARRAPVLAYDLRGHGLSPDRPLPSGIGDYVADLRWLLTERLDAPLVDIVGFSLGGLIAQAYAIAHGDQVNRLVLSNTFARTPHEIESARQRLRSVQDEDRGRAIERSLERWFTPEYLERNRADLEWLVRRLASNDRTAYLAGHEITGTADGGLAADLHRITAPALVLTGEDDVGASPEMAARLAGLLPDAEPQILAGCRHMSMIERPEDYLEAICDFLYAQGPAAEGATRRSRRARTRGTKEESEV
jgi:pimeloyl-ACP methyl ester carboxylesterase